MAKNDKWEHCPRCESNRVKTRFYSLKIIGVSFVITSYFLKDILLIVLHPQDLPSASVMQIIKIIMYSLAIVFFVGGFFTTRLKCKDCGKEWLYPYEKYNSNNNRDK